MCDVRVLGLVTRFAGLAAFATLGLAGGAAAQTRGPAPVGREPRAPSEGALGAAAPRAADTGAVPAAAASPLANFIGGGSTCPLPARVWTELGTLVPAERLVAYRAGQVAASPTESPPSASVEVVDLGPRFRVTTGGRVREYRDDARDCTYRARVAAVFVALVVDPEAMLVELPAPPPVAIPVPVPVPGASPSAAPQVAAPDISARRFQVELGIAVDRSLGSGPRATHPGGAVRLILGRGSLALVVGAAAFLAEDAEVNGLRVNQRRDRLDLGLRGRWPRSALEPFAEIGLDLALISEGALNLDMNARQQTVEAGGFAALGARVPAGRSVGFYLTGRAEWIPNPVAIRALPTGVVGHVPAFWTGASGGVSVEF